METPTVVKRTFLSNKATANGIFRLMANCINGVVKYSIEKQSANLHWDSGVKYTKYLNATAAFLSIQ